MTAVKSRSACSCRPAALSNTPLHRRKPGAPRQNLGMLPIQNKRSFNGAHGLRAPAHAFEALTTPEMDHGNALIVPSQRLVKIRQGALRVALRGAHQTAKCRSPPIARV